MQETINGFNEEVNKVNMVIDKLVTTQNNEVFEKIFNKLSDLVDRVVSVKNEDLDADTKKPFIACLYRLKASATKIASYYHYIKDVIEKENNNDNGLQQDSNVFAPPSSSLGKVDTKILSLTNPDLNGHS